jgi:hypothetical protein
MDDYEIQTQTGGYNENLSHSFGLYFHMFPFYTLIEAMIYWLNGHFVWVKWVF